MILSIPRYLSFELYPYIMVRQRGMSFERKSRSHMRLRFPLPRNEPYAWPSSPVIAIMLYKPKISRFSDHFPAMQEPFHGTYSAVTVQLELTGYSWVNPWKWRSKLISPLRVAISTLQSESLVKVERNCGFGLRHSSIPTKNCSS